MKAFVLALLLVGLMGCGREEAPRPPDTTLQKDLIVYWEKDSESRDGKTWENRSDGWTMGFFESGTAYDYISSRAPDKPTIVSYRYQVDGKKISFTKTDGTPDSTYVIETITDDLLIVRLSESDTSYRVSFKRISKEEANLIEH